VGRAIGRRGYGQRGHLLLFVSLYCEMACWNDADRDENRFRLRCICKSFDLLLVRNL
jgi:hypothetical protein